MKPHWQRTRKRMSGQSVVLCLQGTTELEYVADREANILAMMQRAAELGTPVDWLIRAMHDRSLEGGEKLWRKVEHAEPVGEVQFQMASRPGQKARTVKQAIRTRRVTLPAKSDALVVTCVVQWSRGQRRFGTDCSAS